MGGSLAESFMNVSSSKNHIFSNISSLKVFLGVWEERDFEIGVFCTILTWRERYKYNRQHWIFERLYTQIELNIYNVC